MIRLSLVDSILVGLYFAAVLFIGFRAARREKRTLDEYLIAGRTLTLPMFVATLVSTWYGGILGVGEFSYRFGISNWIVFGVPYYLFALLFAFLLAGRIRATNLYTIPDKLELSYDRKTSLLGALLTFILTTPAAYVLMLGILIQLMFGWDLTLSIIVCTLLTTSFLYLGGLRSDVYTNIFEFLLMFIGFAVVLPFAYSKFGGFEFIKSNVPPLHLSWHGGNSVQYILVWFFIALWTLVDPAFHQRCYAARDRKVAKWGILTSILFWLVFDFMTSTAGLYARAALPDLQQPMFSYPMLAEVTLPVIFKGLFYIGMLATIMSTLSSLALISAISFGRDVLLKLRPEAGEMKAQRYTQVGLFVTGTVSVVLALLVPSVVRLWYVIGTAIIPGLFVPLVTSYFDRLRVSARWAFYSMLLGWLTSTGSLLYGQLRATPGGPGYPFGLEPMYPGLFVSVLMWGIGWMNLQRTTNAARG
jgi:SSS family solute:Na+ symporter